MRAVSRPDADVIAIGSGLAGLVAAAEAADAGRRVLVLDQEGEQSLGGQAFWSLGGLFLVDTPEQRRLGIRDSHELAHGAWMTTAGFDRVETCGRDDEQSGPGNSVPRGCKVRGFAFIARPAPPAPTRRTDRRSP